ncbi:MAG: 3-oxoacid CoA-transferase subunit A [Chloroflexi bacterium]|nr:3-oxoacid CoA-transferase subunit A [Chloroflexota bacterium]
MNSFAEAVADIGEGSSIMVMTFIGPAGIPQNLIMALSDLGPKDLTIVACSNFGFGVGVRERPLARFVTPNILVENGQVKKALVTWDRGESGLASSFEKAVREKKVERELVPLGVLAHRLRAGGSGVGAFYSPIGVGTLYEQGKEKRVIDGREYLLEYPIRAQYGFVRAHRADTLGNLIYKNTARGFNPLIAKACDVTIAEVDEIVEPGGIDPNCVVTPGVYVDRILRIPQGGLR